MNKQQNVSNLRFSHKTNVDGIRLEVDSRWNIFI